MLRTIRGVEVEVHAEEWEYDPSVGINGHFGVIYAETLDGQPFELTAEEEEALGIEAVEAMFDDDDL